MHWIIAFYLNRCTVFLASPKLVYLKLRYSSSHRICSVEKMFLKISQNSLKNICDRVCFGIKLQAWACNFLKIVTGTGVFLFILWNFQEHLLYRTPPGDCFCKPIIACINSFYATCLFLCPKNRKPEALNGLIPNLFLRTPRRDYLHK